MANKTATDKQIYIWALLRVVMGLIFLWAFFDKLFGLGYATKPDKSWLLGNSPTTGFLKGGVRGPLADFYHNLAGNPLIDWLFMLGLLLLGLALLLGIGLKMAGYAGALLMLLMWSALLPPTSHPFLDDHIVYLLVLLSLAHSQAGDVWGLGKWWSSSELVKDFPLLR